MSTNRLLHILVLAALFIGGAFPAMGKKPVLKNSTWKAVQEEFVADAGTMTITHTLEFTSAKDVLVKEETHMPSHPAMYMNPDGTVDRIPGWSSENSQAGTYTFRRGILTVMLEDGSRKDYTFRDNGTFTREEPWGAVLEFLCQPR